MTGLLRKSIADATFHGVNDDCNLSQANCEMLADSAIERYQKAESPAVPPGMEFTKVERLNNWGSLYYAYPGCGKCNGMASAGLALPLRDGQEVVVRWPDGSVTTEVLAKKPHAERIHDHGSYYTTKSWAYGVRTSVRGLEEWAPLERLEVLVSSVDIESARKSVSR